jgi:predicted nucleic acid-binding protein
MDVTVTITGATPELLDALKNFLNSGVETLTKSAPSRKPATTKVVEAAPVEEVVEQGEAVTVEQVRAAVQTQAQAGKKDAIKALLKKYGADNVTSLDEQHFSEFLTKVKAL